jgi:hypothetical protein
MEKNVSARNKINHGRQFAADRAGGTKSGDIIIFPPSSSAICQPEFQP